MKPGASKTLQSQRCGLISITARELGFRGSLDEWERSWVQLRSGNVLALETILAVIAIIFVLISYITSGPLVPVAVILLGPAMIFGARGSGSLRNS